MTSAVLAALPKVAFWELESLPAYPDMSHWEAERTLPLLLAWLRESGPYPDGGEL